MVEEYPEHIEDEIKKMTSSVVFIEPKVLIQEIGDKKFINVAFCGMLLSFLPYKSTMSDIIDFQL